MNDDASAATITVGIDLGTLQTKVTLGPTYDHELVRNSHGDHTLPTAITFPGQHRARLIGEDAADVSRADGNTVAMLDRLLVGSLAGEEDPLAAFRRFEYDATCDAVSIPSMAKQYSSTQLMAMFVGRIKRNVLSTIARIQGSESGGDKSLNFVFAVPPSYPTCTREALMDAAHAASVSNCAVVDSTEAVTAVYAKKFGDAAAATAGDGGDKKVVLVVEMGHARTSVSLLQLGDDGGVFVMHRMPLGKRSTSTQAKSKCSPTLALPHSEQASSIFASTTTSSPTFRPSHMLNSEPTHATDNAYWKDARN